MDADDEIAKIKAHLEALDTALAIIISSLKDEEKAGILAMLVIARNAAEKLAHDKANPVAADASFAWDKLLGDIHRLL